MADNAQTPIFQAPAPPAQSIDAQVVARVERDKSAGLTTDPAYARWQIETEAGFERDRTPANTRRDGSYSNEYLDRVATTTQAAEADRLLNESMMPAQRPGEYQLPRAAGTPDNAETLAQETALRTAMHEAKLPAWVGTSIAQSFYDTSEKIGRMSAGQLAEQRADTYTMLERMWGSGAPGRIERVQKFMTQAARKHPALNQVALLLDLTPTALDTLSQFVEYQARRK